MSGDDESDSFESDWPRDGDRLFAESNRLGDLHTTTNPAERFYRMPMGYKRAGDILVDHAVAGPADRKNIIYPALFCYRQAIELFLKRLLVDFDSGSVSALNVHDFGVLWARFARLTEELGGTECIGFEAAAALVKELNEADHRSDAFRFATGQKGDPFSFGDVGFDLEKLREAMQALANFFEAFYSDYTVKTEGWR